MAETHIYDGRVCVCVSHIGHQRHCGHKVHNNKANKWTDIVMPLSKFMGSKFIVKKGRKKSKGSVFKKILTKVAPNTEK